jgi:hypothetical protein
MRARIAHFRPTIVRESAQILQIMNPRDLRLLPMYACAATSTSGPNPLISIDCLLWDIADLDIRTAKYLSPKGKFRRFF